MTTHRITGDDTELACVARLRQIAHDVCVPDLADHGGTPAGLAEIADNSLMPFAWAVATLGDYLEAALGLAGVRFDQNDRDTIRLVFEIIALTANSRTVALPRICAAGQAAPEGRA